MLTAVTASLGVHSNDVPVPAELAEVSCRPDAIVPCYAVINDHEGSFNNLFGESANDVTREYFCLNKHVSADTPPAFFWHTAKDVGVPVANALDFCSALDRNGVSFELHVFPRGDHGLGLAVNIPEAAIWPELVSAWLTQMGWK